MAGISDTPRHYKKQSAVVTRRSEPTITRILAGFCKFSVSDAMLNALFFLEAKALPELLRTPAALSGKNRAPKGRAFR
jgi:hypothetical protein